MVANSVGVRLDLKSTILVFLVSVLQSVPGQTDMVCCRSKFDFLDLKCSLYSSHSHVFIFGLILCSHTLLSSHVQASVVSCKPENVSVDYGHCRIHPDGVRDLDCFGKHNSRGAIKCVWKPGNHTSEKTHTLIIQQQSKKHCKSYTMSSISPKISVFQSHNMSAEVFENSQSTNCTKAVFSGSPKSLLRCGPPYDVSFSRHSGKLAVTVSWLKEDVKAIENYSVRYKALGSLLWSKSPAKSQNREKCVVENLNSSLVYTVQIQCVANVKCSQCVWSEAYNVPQELTTQPVIVNLHFSDIAGRNGCRLLYLTWKFPAKELHDGFSVTIGKASGEAPYERINTSQPEIRLILSYSSYHLSISAVNNASISPAVSQTLPQQQDVSGMGSEKLNMTVHSNTSFTIHWRDNLIKKYVCYSVEWMRTGQKAAHMSFHQNKNNHKTLSPLPEPLEPYERYSITLHTRPNKDTCNMKHINNSESTYGSTQFYFIEGAPVGAPGNISSSNVTLNSMTLQWSSIRETDIRGFLLGYTIHYAEYHTMDTTNTERMDPELNSYELEDLKSGTAYKVQISGFTRAGAGVRSTASLFETNYQGISDLTALITIFAVMATVLIIGTPIIKKAKVILWPSIPNPGNSNAMQKIERPCELELLESIDTLKVEGRDTNSLQIIEKEAVIPASTSASMLPLLDTSGDETDSPEINCDWAQSDTEDLTGDSQPDNNLAGTLPDIQRTEVLQSSPIAFPSGYTTMELFQQGTPQHVMVNTSVTQVIQSELEETDLTVLKSRLDYVRQFSTSPIMDGKEMSTVF